MINVAPDFVPISIERRDVACPRITLTPTAVRIQVSFGMPEDSLGRLLRFLSHIRAQICVKQRLWGKVCRNAEGVLWTTLTKNSGEPVGYFEEIDRPAT
jgi:hypothetical protein